MIPIKYHRLFSIQFSCRTLECTIQHALYSNANSPPTSLSSKPLVLTESRPSLPDKDHTLVLNDAFKALKINQKNKIQLQIKSAPPQNSLLNAVGPTVRSSERYMPSHSSGGVPSATAEYLKASYGTPLKLPIPQQLLVVIDLNGTLVHRKNGRQSKNIIVRPHALRFLEYCLNTFKVVIWSSARPKTVESVVNKILPPSLQEKLVATWARDTFSLSETDYHNRVLCYKRLTKIWNDETIAKSHPTYSQGNRWDQTNTVLIDDSVEKGRSEPYNLIQIPEFLGDCNKLQNVLPKVHEYLNELSLHSSVCSYIHSNPFSMDHAENLVKENKEVEQN